MTEARATDDADETGRVPATAPDGRAEDRGTAGDDVAAASTERVASTTTPAERAPSTTEDRRRDTATSPAVRVDALSHGWTRGGREHRVLDALALDIARGESVALIGRSGSGKSTLLNIIGGLEPVQRGRVEVLGRALEGLDDRARTLLRRRDIGFVHQSFNLIPTLTVGDNVTLPLALAGTPARERRARLAEQLAAVGLDGRADDHPDTLSGGEQQRVAIARALIHRPPLLLADEPTGNLDAESGRRVLGLLAELVERDGAAMLVVTHSLEVAGVADRAFALVEGRLRALAADALASGSVW